MSKNYKLKLNLPQELNAAQQRTVEGTDITVTRGEGYNGPLTDAELKLVKADPYVVIDGGKDTSEDEAAAKAKAEADAKKKAEEEAAAKKAADEKAAKEAADKKAADEAAAKAKAEADAKANK